MGGEVGVVEVFKVCNSAMGVFRAGLTIWQVGCSKGTLAVEGSRTEWEVSSSKGIRGRRWSRVLFATLRGVWSCSA